MACLEEVLSVGLILKGQDMSEIIVCAVMYRDNKLYIICASYSIGNMLVDLLLICFIRVNSMDTVAQTTKLVSFRFVIDSRCQNNAATVSRSISAIKFPFFQQF